MTASDLLLIVAVVGAFVGFTAFIGVAMASEHSHKVYPGTKVDRFRDLVVMNVPALPFLTLLSASCFSGVEDGPCFTLALALCAGFTLGGHFLPPVKRARERFRTAYAKNPPWR
ncbi:MAG: hypothetical protein ACK4MI_15135 [Brevundimonas sp.]|uniref:hypothetical protein n=1 Tax=Brevundimonas sp. TaxID=1871086 RepID=UPI0028D4F8DA|nr:hypothetical protein [uncultured Brevundimonas sp.]